MLKAKPLAYKISTLAPYTKIFYSCPRCETSFKMFGEQELFCHSCGLPIDWDVLKELPSPFTTESWEIEKKILDTVNELNKIKGEITEEERKLKERV